MLKAFQNKPLEVSPDKERGGYFAYVEAWKDNSSPHAVPAQPTIKHLRETEVEEWTRRKGPFESIGPLPSGNNTTTHASRIRILFAEARSTYRHAIPEILTKGDVLQALNLPSHTFSALQLDSGMYSSHCLPEGSTVATCTSLAFVFRTPQLKDCSIGGLSVSYDFKHDTTTALILGYAFDIKALDGDPTKTPRSLAQFVRQLFDCHLCWGHPLLLPCIFLVEHAQRVQKYATGILSRRVVLVEHSIGVTKTGRSGIVEYDFPNEREHANDQMLFVDGHMQRQNAKKLVGTSTWSQARRHCWMADDYEVNELSTTIIFAQRSPQWDVANIDFLSKILEHIRLQKLGNAANNAFRETLDYLQNYCESSSELVRSSRARVDLQLNILYTAIAQDDGQTGARLAINAGKDSTSMKIIALITAAYLPGTFVATLFSMSMFDWENTRITSSFYIYWAVTVPLTIVTISGWALWWKVEKQRFVRDEQQAATNEPSTSRRNAYHFW